MTSEGRSQTVVIHRTPHPTEGRGRWFTYKDRDYLVVDQGPGWGYTIWTVGDYHTVSDGMFTLDEVRREAASRVDGWLDEQDEIEYMQTHDGERRPGTRPEYEASADASAQT